MTWVRGTRIVAVVVGVFLLPALVVLAHLQDTRTEPVSEPSPFIDCRPYSEPTSVRQINAFIRTQRSTPGCAGGDVGASTELADGRSFWVFGDTLRDADPGEPSMVRNSILLMGDGCAGVYRPDTGGAAIPDRDDGVGYWPTTVDSMPDGQGGTRVVVGLMRIRPTGNGVWDFEIVGASAARFQVPANDVPELVGVYDIGLDDPDMSKPLWSAAAALADDGTVYLYGTANPGRPMVFGYSLHVARTTVPGLTDQSSWEYWDGRRWVRDASAAVALIPADNGVSRALSVFERGGTWYAVSKQADYLGSRLEIWKAPAPTGPFTATGSVADLPSDDRTITYLALAHPELLAEDGSVVVSWSVNSTDPSVVQRDPTVYRPQFRRVPLP